MELHQVLHAVTDLW